MEICVSTKSEPNGFSDPDPKQNGSSSLFNRRVEFHLARQQYNGFSKGAPDFDIETLNPGSGSANSNKRVGSNAGQLKADGSDLIDIGLDPELIFGFSLRKIGAGLENLGNTCFLNSVLQCLTHTEPLAAYLQSGKHQNSCRVAGFCALCAIQRHVSRALQSSGRIVSPKDLVLNLHCISRNFRNSRQEDAHEYMVNLLESMHKCCLPSGVASESPSAYEKSLVHKIFGGRLRSQVKCLQCSYGSNKFDPFIDLSLEIEKADSLYKALSSFTAPEKLDGGEKQYNCQQCKQKVRALKQLTVHKAPYVLTIHLKRFRAHNPGQKIDKKIQFDPTLDLKPFVSGSHKGDLKYTLYGVLVHCGWSTRSGHYYCFVRTSSGMWHSLDDNRVVPVSERKVLEQKAYMLFYVRDKGSLVPRKPAGVAHTENTKTNLIGNKTFSNLNHALRELNQNGVEENKPKMLNPSPLIKKDAVLPVTNIVKEEPRSITDNAVTRENLFCKTDPALQSSTNEQKRIDSSKCLSDSTLSRGKIMLSLASPITNNGCTTHNHENGGVKIGAKDIDSSETFGSQKKPCVSAPCSDPQEGASDKVLTEKICQEAALVIASSHDLEANKLEKIDFVRPSTTPSSNQAKSMPTNSDLIVAKNGDNSLKSSIESVEPSNGSMDRKASDDTCRRRCKKKLLNGQSVSMPFGTSMFLRASLGLLRKKKQLRRSKHRASYVQNLIKESMLKSDTLSSGFGPSTSEKTKIISLETASNKKRVTSSNKENKKCSKSELIGSHSESLISIVAGEFQGRVSRASTVPEADGQLQNSPSSSIAKILDVQESKSASGYRRDTVENGFVGMLTRGLEEPVVARWDDIDLPSRQVVQSTAKKNFHIGYVPDEWDEEYDRGKRKKIRQSKAEFGGPNLFQEAANKKIQHKKAKMDQTSSGNKPYRI